MSKIYREAEMVLFWLGPGTAETTKAMLHLQWLRLQVDQVEAYDQPRDILEMGERNQLELRRRIATELIWGYGSYDSACCSLGTGMHWERTYHHKQGFKELLLVPWFKRVWILQEVANASAALVCCGIVSIPADTFCLLFPLVYDHLQSIRGSIQVGVGRHIKGIIDMMPSPFKTIWNSVGFYHLLQRFGDSQATDPRDIVYGMRGLSGDSEHPEFPPTDYEITEVQLTMRISQFIFRHDLTHWARLSTMSDLVNQLEWLLSVAITIHLDSTFCQNLVQLVPDGIVRLTGRSLRLPLETGHWRRIPEIIRLSNGRFVRFQSDAVIATFRKCDLTVARYLMKVFRLPLTDLLYASLQNQTFGPELVRETFKGREKEGRRRVGNYACGLLYGLFCQHSSTFESRFEPGNSVVYVNCLAAILHELFRGQRAFDIQSDWCDKNTQTLLGYASKAGDAALLDTLLDRGASVDGWSEGHTPLMLVAMNRNEYTAPLMVKLLHAGADAGLKTAGAGLTAMDLARHHGNDVAVGILTACAQSDVRGESRLHFRSYVP